MSFPKGRGGKVTHCLQTTKVSLTLIRRSTTPFYIFHLISRILLTYINDGSKYTFVKFFLQVIGVSIVFDIDSFDYLITLSHKTFEKQPSHFYCLVVKIHNTQYTHTLWGRQEGTAVEVTVARGRDTAVSTSIMHRANESRRAAAVTPRIVLVRVLGNIYSSREEFLEVSIGMQFFFFFPFFFLHLF